MESRHVAPNVNVSLRKVRAYLPAIKKLSPLEATVHLDQIPYSATCALSAEIKTAMSNAENTLKVSKGMLEFRSLKADQGMVLKRFRAGSRGTAKPVLRRMTHITIVLGAKKIDVAKKVEETKVVETKKTDTNTDKKKVVEAPKKVTIRKTKSITKKKI